MGIFPAFRGFRHLGPIALLVLALRPAGFLLAEFLPHGHAESPVEISRIEVPGSTAEACEHHPAGCPKGCFCPKTPIQEAHAQEPDFVPGEMNQPSLAHCTQQAAADEYPCGPVFQAAEWLPAVPAVRVERLFRAPQPSLPTPPSDSPLKIPIA